MGTLHRMFPFLVGKYRRSILNGQAYIDPHKAKIVAFPIKISGNGKSENSIQSLLKGEILEFSRDTVWGLLSTLFEQQGIAYAKH